MTRNNQIFLKKIYTIFIAGLILSVLSVFLPWYSFTISLLGETFNWIFSPLEGWTIENSYEFTPPDMSAITPYFYIIFIYAGIMLSVLIINMTTENKQENKYIPYLIYFGVAQSGFSFIFFLYLLISQNFYVPYIQIDQIAGELVQTRIYSMGPGSAISFFAVILLIFAGCFFKASYNYSILENEDRIQEKEELNSIEVEEISENSLNLTPGEEYQLLEEKFIDTRMNALKKEEKK